MTVGSPQSLPPVHCVRVGFHVDLLPISLGRAPHEPKRNYNLGHRSALAWWTVEMSSGQRASIEAHGGGRGQWSRLKPSNGFHFEGLSNFSPSVEMLVQIQEHQSKNTEMKLYKTHIKLVHEWYGTCFQYNVNKSRINHLTPLFVVTMPCACWFS